MDFTQFLNYIQSAPTYAGQLVYLRETPAREARYAETERPLSLAAAAMLRARGIARLYTHQAEAIDAVRAGENALVVTGTASGKSLSYTAPLLELLAEDPRAAALLLFPTKALTQDQYTRFAEALTVAELRETLVGVYDGDTPSNVRRKLRDGGAAIFTNPDMLHAGLMPQHARWTSFLSRLRLLVLDELHVYNGIFGSNMANLLRHHRQPARAGGAADRATVPGDRRRRLPARQAHLRLLEPAADARH